MNSRVFLKFIFINIKRNISKYSSIFFIATILITILLSFIFISDSIKYDINLIIKNQPSVVIQKIHAGKVVDIPQEYEDELLNINGIKNITCQVSGKYFYEPSEEYFTIIGVNFYSKAIQKDLKELSGNIDLDKFLSKPYMIVGNGVKQFLDYYEYKNYYNFRPSDRSVQKLYIYAKFDNRLNIIASDTIVMDISKARRILDIKDEYCTNLALDIPNKNELTTILDKIKSKYWDIQIITQDDLMTYYSKFFSYKSSLFLLLYLLLFLTFILIIYQRYSLVHTTEKKEIAILRIIGWSIVDILKLKVLENSVIFISAFLLAINLAYLYVFVFNAPLLQNIFLGYLNLSTNVSFTPVINFSTVYTIFLFFIIPLISIVLYPIWKIAIIQPTKAMQQ